MKNTFKIIIAVILISIISSPFSVSHAQDAEYQLIRRTYKVNNDGTVDIRFRKELKLLRNRAITAYADKGETFILYNPAIDELTINESYTIRPDGSRVQTPANAFIDQLPSQCENCGRYNGIRGRVVVHTALEYNCIIVLDYTIHRKSNILSDNITLTQDCPVKKYEIILDVPNQCHHSVEYTNFEKNPQIINDGHAFHLIAKNLSQKLIDNYLPDNLYPTVSIDCGDSHGLFLFEHENDEVPEANDLLGELYDKDQRTYATNIRDYVVDHIRTINIPEHLVDYRYSTASMTFNSNCGTPSDKTILLYALLKQAGFTMVDYNDQVCVKIPGTSSNDLNYILSAKNKNKPRPDGAAVDEQRSIVINRILDWKGTSISGGYEQMLLPVENGSINIDPAMLTSVRTAPVKLRNCNEKYRYTFTMPAKAKLVKPIKINYSKNGVGCIKVNIKQLESGALEVVRELDINVEDGIVTPKQYKAFRQLMQDWEQYRTITIKR